MFSWDTRKATLNYRKHGVSFEEAATIFADPEGLDWDDLTHSREEPRYKRLGVSVEENVLLVVYTIRRSEDDKETIRLISARRASRKEREAYSG